MGSWHPGKILDKLKFEKVDIKMVEAFVNLDLEIYKALVDALMEPAITDPKIAFDKASAIMNEPGGIRDRIKYIMKQLGLI
jgi:hypothetical protein